MNFNKEMLQYQFERVIIKAQFENGLKEFRGVFTINNTRDEIYLCNTSDLYPQFPFVQPYNFHIVILMPGAGLVILFNYVEFNNDDLQVTFSEQFVPEYFRVKMDDFFYGDNDIEDISSYCSSVRQRIYNQYKLPNIPQKENPKISNVSEHQNKVSSVKIGTQEWTCKNLDVSTFRNGDEIKEVKTNEEWEQRTANGKPAWCYYCNDPKNGQKYGKLYNWWAVNDPRGLAPKGFHIPSDAEWTELINFLGGMDDAGTKMKSISGWKENGNGTNSSGFSAIPAGKRYILGGFDRFDNDDSYWWSSTESNTYMAWFWTLYFYDGRVIKNQAYKLAGMCVRCVKD